MTRKHNHYFKDVTKLDTIDVYRVLALFNVTDPCLQHAVKKLLAAGSRGAGKDITRDIKEAIDSLQRWQEMRTEDASVVSAVPYIGEDRRVDPRVDGTPMGLTQHSHGGTIGRDGGQP